MNTVKSRKHSSKTSPQDAALAQVKVPPHSIEAEQAVLGGLMVDHRAWDKIVGKLGEPDFYQADHRIIFRTIARLASRASAFDALTVAAAVKEQQAGQPADRDLSLYVYELANNTSSVANIPSYVAIVRERSILRQLIAISNEIANAAFNPQGRPAQEILAEAESKLFKIAQQEVRGDGPLPITTFMTGAVERIDALYKSGKSVGGIPTGFIDFDEKTSGLQKGDLIVVAGRPSMGKTAFAMNIATHVAQSEKKPVLVFSMEMPGESLATRLISAVGGVDQQGLRTGRLRNEDWHRITSAISQVDMFAPMLVDDTAALSPAELRSRARRVAREQGGLGLIMVDYLQLMQVPGFKDNRALEISEISRSLKAMAKEMEVPVVALSQLNRGLEQRQEKRPLMSDLRESGAIEQDADLIVFIYRDEVYDKNSPHKGKAEIIIAKQRNGPIGSVNLTFLGQFTRFENYAAESYL